MTEYLEANLEIAYPFADGVDDDVVNSVSDIIVVSEDEGPFEVTLYSPQFPDMATEFRLRIQNAAGVVLDTVGCTVVDLGDFYSLTMVDGDTTARVMASKPLTQFLGSHSGVFPLVGSVGFLSVAGVSTVNGLSGDVIIDYEDFAELTVDTNDVARIDFLDPVDRLTCPPPGDDEVFGLDGARADNRGSIHIEATDCYRLVPDPDPDANPNQLVLYNFCEPCVDCLDVETLQDKGVDQSEYYHRLGAIHFDQFNRYQGLIANVNSEISDVETRGDLVIVGSGVIDIIGRVFNRPYFTQVFISVVNNSLHTIDVELTLAVTPAGLLSQLQSIPESWTVLRTLRGGKPFDGFTGFPGTVQFTLGPQDSIGFNSEMKRMIISTPTTGQWEVDADLTFTSGPTPLPAPANVAKNITPGIVLLGAPRTQI